MTTTHHVAAPANQSDGRHIDLQDQERRAYQSSFQETKSAFKTTELYIYLAAVAGVLIASYLVGANDMLGETGGDYFAADKAWLYVVILTVGYMVGRGLAKSGSRTNSSG